jgi:LuxR family maltose regulon positive regulatory protein
MFLINTGAFEAAAREVDKVEQKLLAAGSGQAQGRLAGVTAMRCFIACSQNDMERAQNFASQALRDLRVNEDVGFRPGIYVSLGDTYRANGRWEEAKECYLKALSFAEVPGVRVASVHLYGALADLDLKQGNLHQAAAYWRKALAVIQDQAAWGWYSLPVTGWVYIRLGEVLYEWNNLEEAREHLERGLERAELGGDVRARIAGYLLAFRLKLVEGDLQAAGKYLEQVQSLLESSPFPEWIPRFERLQLEFWLAQNHLRAAVQRAGELLQGAALDRQHESETAQLAVARAFIAQGDAPSLKHARQLLTSLIEAAQAKGRIAISIEAQALQALVYWKRGDPASAMTYLEGALRQAEPEGYARLFVDLGLPMVRLLQEARLRAVLPEYVEKLLAACEVNLPFPVSTEKRLPEPLTPREQEILELLSAGLTNAEIAEKLIISPETVKKHLRHLYGKLGTGNRTEAVARARALSLLG